MACRGSSLNTPAPDTMPWLQLRIPTSPEQAPAIEAAADAAGALAVTLEDNADQPIFEPALGETPLWQHTRVTALFDAAIDTGAKLREVEKRLSKNLPDAWWHILEDKDWEREWMQHFEPIQCAPKLWVCPSWREPPDPNAINLLLDPGLAFGTGTHPTTFLCLRWLASRNLQQKTLIDYGCGSGILGVAALLLGAASVIGVDIDPQALLATKDNTKRNALDPARFPVYLPKTCPQQQVDVVVANILAGPLVDLAEDLCRRLKPGGELCLSGVLANQYDALETVYKNYIDITDMQQREEWICIAGVKSQVSSR